MTPTNVTPLHNRQRNPLDFSLKPQEEQRRDGILRTAWLKIVDGFDCRPQPRSAWDHAADLSEARWTKLIQPMRMAVASAVFIGNPQLIDQTMEGVRDFLRAIEADIASLIPPREEAPLVSLALEEAECGGPATVEAMRLVAHPSPTEAERAIEPLLKESTALARLLEGVQRLARQPSMRMAR